MIRGAIVAGIFIGLIGCGSVTPRDDDGGRGGSGGEGGGAGTAADAGIDMSECAPPAFDCLGVQGGCGVGEESAQQRICGVLSALCCPVNVCDPAQCHACTGCP